MGLLDVESQADRKTWILGFAAFVVGFVCVFAAITNLLVRYVWPEQGWWTVGDAIRYLIPYPFFGGVGLACATMTVVERRYYRLGIYRCWQCHRPLKFQTPCPPKSVGSTNPFARARSERLHRLRRRRWQIKVAMLGYLAVLPPAILLTLLTRPGAYPLLMNVVVVHGVLCVFVAVAMELLADLAPRLTSRGKRWQKRWEACKIPLMMWPMAMMLTLVCTG